ncbi:MAG: rod-binding protein [Thermogutta sp.]|nr:rod-binding protein [Thermogutta sp.]HOP77262.1 rod-binding protein [Thermogutta sp.]HPU07426.1 rod-binding protein [Thermogutta sp.]HQF13063.1 rod-binding protein [Thermogutta sp.]
MTMLRSEAVSQTHPLAVIRSPSNGRSRENTSQPFVAYLDAVANRTAAPSPFWTGNAASAQFESRDVTTPPQDTQQDKQGHGISPTNSEDEELEKVFRRFVGQTFFGLMLKEMRKSIHKTPYFHGGLAEQIFEQHLDMTLAEKLADASGDKFSKPMYELFQLQRRG